MYHEETTDYMFKDVFLHRFINYLEGRCIIVVVVVVVVVVAAAAAAAAAVVNNTCYLSVMTKY
jgi:hypothetical protein